MIGRFFNRRPEPEREPEPEQQGPPIHPSSETEAALSVALVRCLLNPGDYAQVAGYRTPENGTPIVNVKVYENGTWRGVVVSPETARVLAAGILNAADAAEGTTPLTFVPPAQREGGAE